jgi:hypothetical protein
MPLKGGSLPQIRILGDLGEFQASLNLEKLGPRLHQATLSLKALRPAVPLPLTLQWDQLAMDVQAVWTPANQRDRGIE